MDNIEGKSASELKQMFLDAQVSESKPKEQPKEPEASVKPEVIKAPEAKSEDEKILGKFKSVEDLEKSYKELERKLSEVTSQKKETVGVEPTQPATDLLYEALFKTAPQTTAKAAPESADFDTEDPKTVELRKRLENLEKVGYYSLMQQQAVTEKLTMSDALREDPILPWSKSVESEIESKVFNQYPNLRYTKGGYALAHKILKAEKSSEIIESRTKEAVEKALAQRKENATAKVETPTKGDPEPEIDYAKLSTADLRKHLKKELGIREVE